MSKNFAILSISAFKYSRSSYSNIGGVVAIFSILIAYTFIHAALLTYNGAGKWVPGSLQLLSYFVIANALWLAVSLWRMGAERKERRARASLIRDQHKVALMAAGLHSSPDINMEEKAGTEH